MRVAIIGAGVAGPTLAWWLKHYGFDPVLYEIAPRLRKGGYVIDFWGVGYDVAEKMKLVPEIRRRGHDFQELRLVDSRGKIAARTGMEAFRSVTNGRFLSIARSELSSVIWNAGEGIETHFGATIDNIEQDSDCVRLNLKDGRQEKFDLLVGADGLHSRVREEVFGSAEQFEKPLGYYVAAFQSTGYEQRDELVYVAHSAPHCQVARIALPGDETLFFFIFASHLLDSEPTDETAQRRALESVFGDMKWEVRQILEQLQVADGFYFDRVSQIVMEHWTKNRVALVGDAAACVSLLAGEGTGLAMAEAYVLAGELQRAGGDFNRAMQQYEMKLRSFLRKKQKTARSMTAFFAPKSRFHMKLRDLAMNAMRIPFVAKLLLKRSFQDDLELPHYQG